jgi:hypothetical protein
MILRSATNARNKRQKMTTSDEDDAGAEREPEEAAPPPPIQSSNTDDAGAEREPYAVAAFDQQCATLIRTVSTIQIKAETLFHRSSAFIERSATDMTYSSAGIESIDRLRREICASMYELQEIIADMRTTRTIKRNT